MFPLQGFFRSGLEKPVIRQDPGSSSISLDYIFLRIAGCQDGSLMGYRFYYGEKIGLRRLQQRSAEIDVIIVERRRIYIHGYNIMIISIVILG